MRVKKVPQLSQRKVRSALRVTSSVDLLRNVDHRCHYMRRLRDVLDAHHQDLACGDAASLSKGQRALARRAAVLEVECEMLEKKFALKANGANIVDLDVYQRASNTMRRLFEALQLHRGRRPRLVGGETLDDETAELYQRELEQFGETTP
jgi:hypothetical protein